MAATIYSSREAESKLNISELNVTAHIFAPFHVTTKNRFYHLIFGIDLLEELGIQLDFQNNIID